MAVVQDIASWIFILGGAAFLLIGGLGLIRMPDFYTRLHAAGITDTMASELLLVGMMIQAGFSLVTVKLAIIGLFLFFTSPTATHAVANAALVAGLKPYLKMDPAVAEDPAPALSPEGPDAPLPQEMETPVVQDKTLTEEKPS